MDNFLYQNELGLVDQSDLERITGVIDAQYADWVGQGGSAAFARVEEWYQQHRAEK
jgi:hypothetical protein